MPSAPELSTPTPGGEALPSARLVIEGEQGPEIIALDRSPFTIGRLGDLRVSDGRISRRHAQIVCQGGQYLVEDLGSSNGTFVNEVRIDGRTVLTTGDVVRVGPLRIAFVREQLSGGASEEISTAIRGSRAQSHPRLLAGADLTQRVAAVPRQAVEERARPTVQADPGSIASPNHSLDDVGVAGVLLVSLGSERLQVPIETRLELDHALSLSGLSVSGSAGTVLLRDGSYWLDTRPDRDVLLLNGRPLSGTTQLSPGDQVSVGPVELEFQLLE